MPLTLHNLPREPRTHWRGGALPEPGWLAGYSALIEHFELPVPAPPCLAMIAERHRPTGAADWLVLPRRRKPENTLRAHLELALKVEGVRLSVLSALFGVVPAQELAAWVTSAPTGKYVRRVWFLYEWLTGEQLPLPDLEDRLAAVQAVDPAQQMALPEGELSRRHRVRDNLPGTPQFCPMVRWTPALREQAQRNLSGEARAVVGRTHPDVTARAAAFLLLSDSQSSFAIEGETPPRERMQRWGQAIAEAGATALTARELERLQRIVIGDERFVSMGLRQEGGFIGMRHRHTGEPLPEHISAKPEDVPGLVEGVLAFIKRAQQHAVDPVLVAAVAAFGFVYIHPFEDGNGRVHRWLIHHVLAEAGYNPPELPFPVSAAILRNLTTYRQTLRSYSKPLLPLIAWEPTGRGNVRVLGDTAVYYRYFDATAHAEFLYHCVEETVRYDLPREVAFLEGYDAFVRRVRHVVEMPARTYDLLHRFLRQNGGQLSKRARTKEFAALTDAEAEAIEAIFQESMGALGEDPLGEGPLGEDPPGGSASLRG